MLFISETGFFEGLLECATKYPVDMGKLYIFGVIVGVVTLLLKLSIMRDEAKEQRAKFGDDN